MGAQKGGLYTENAKGERVLEHQTQPRPKEEKVPSQEPSKQRPKKPAANTEATGETS